MIGFASCSHFAVSLFRNKVSHLLVYQLMLDSSFVVCSFCQNVSICTALWVPASGNRVGCHCIFQVRIPLVKPFMWQHI